MLYFPEIGKPRRTTSTGLPYFYNLDMQVEKDEPSFGAGF